MVGKIESKMIGYGRRTKTNYSINYGIIRFINGIVLLINSIIPVIDH